MAIHLLRPAVGVQDIHHLYEICEGQDRPHITTRSVPKRLDELVEGGSLYRIISRKVCCRQKIVGYEEFEDTDGRRAAHIFLSSEIIRTRIFRRKHFQGWRYLQPEDAPQDIGPYQPGGKENMPGDMAQNLAELGLL